jgi:hypothetical protein
MVDYDNQLDRIEEMIDDHTECVVTRLDNPNKFVFIIDFPKKSDLYSGVGLPPKEHVKETKNEINENIDELQAELDIKDKYTFNLKVE